MLSTSWAMLLFLLLLHVSGCAVEAINGSDYGLGDSVFLRNNVECPSMILAYAYEFKRLEPCSVVLGDLYITRIESSTTGHFPLLKEITGTFVIYQVSVRLNFPNLAVVRGRSGLIHGKALVVIGTSFHALPLPSLRLVEHGGIRVTKNSLLCHAGSVAWGRLMRQRTVLAEHRAAVEDGRAFAEESRTLATVRYNAGSCSARDVCAEKKRCPNVVSDGGVRRVLCWSADVCQSVCSDACIRSNLTCLFNDTSICCHPECVGGCYGLGADMCTACRHVVHEGQCVPACPPQLLMYQSRSCITEEECLNKTEGKHIYDGQCLPQCPVNFSADGDGNCLLCQPDCLLDCGKVIVMNLAEVLDLPEGCRSMESLFIKIRNSVNIDEPRLTLRQRLRHLKLIRKGLRVNHTDYLTDLSFLESVEQIGERNASDSFVFWVTQNDRLTALWKPLTNLTIFGRAIVHMNSRLHAKLVTEFLQRHLVHQSAFDWKDVQSTNCHTASCGVAPVTVSVASTPRLSAFISWQVRLSDPTLLHTGMLNVRLLKSTRSLYNDITSCGGTWMRFVVNPCNRKEERDESGKLSFLFTGGIEMTNLKPNSFYNLFFDFKSNYFKRAASSKTRRFFVSGPSSPPKAVRAESLSESSVKVMWCPPRFPNGNITNYVIWYRRLPFDAYTYQRWDMCKQKGPVWDPSWHSPQEPEVICRDEQVKCGCKTSCEDKPTMEDLLYLRVLHDRPNDDSAPQARTVCRDDDAWTVPLREEAEATTEEVVEWDGIVSVNGTKRQAIIDELTPFSQYVFVIRACQSVSFPDDDHKEVDGNYFPTDSSEICGRRETASIYTHPQDGADQVDEESFEFNDEHGISVLWSEPVQPNGVILKYAVRHRRFFADQKEKPSWTRVCLSYSSWRRVHQDLVSARLSLSPPPTILDPMQQESQQLHPLLPAPAASVRGGFKLSESLFPPGSYELAVMAVSLSGNSSWSDSFHFSIVGETRSWGVVYLSFSALLILLVCVVLVLVYRHFRTRTEPIFLTNPNYQNLYEPDDWEIPEEDIVIYNDRVLGRGFFGVVVKGYVRNLQTPASKYFSNQDTILAAVKTTRKNASFQEKLEFLSEANRMKTFHANHVVQLLGVVSRMESRDAVPQVVIEFMSHGDLAGYLRRMAEEEGISAVPEETTMLWAAQIADGMAYLCNNRVVHRDLAARNCLVDARRVVKVADFGLTRELYYSEEAYQKRRNRGGVVGPFMWMSPESLARGKFSSRSDVWSFGVTLWEIVNLGQRPYWNMNSTEVTEFVLGGSSLVCHEDHFDSAWLESCPESTLELMRQCFKFNPVRRPTFVNIVDALAPFFDDVFQRHSFVLQSRAANQIRAQIIL